MKLNRKQTIISYCLLPLIIPITITILVLRKIFYSLSLLFDNLTCKTYDVDDFMGSLYCKIIGVQKS